MGLYYRNSTGEDMLIAGSSVGGDGFNEAIVGTTSMLSSVTQQLTFRAGNNITLTGNSSTNQITISSTGGISTSDNTAYEAIN